jgi:hypothetical protein
VGDQIEALRRVAGDEAVALIREVPDPFIQTSSRAGRATSTQPVRAI